MSNPISDSMRALRRVEYAMHDLAALLKARTGLHWRFSGDGTWFTLTVSRGVGLGPFGVAYVREHDVSIQMPREILRARDTDTQDAVEGTFTYITNGSEGEKLQIGRAPVTVADLMTPETSTALAPFFALLPKPLAQ